LNIPSNQKPSTTEIPLAPVTAIQSEKLSDPASKVPQIAATISGVENIPVSGIPGHKFTKIFNNEHFAPLRLPPGPKDAPILKVSLPTPIPSGTSIPSITPKRSLSTNSDTHPPITASSWMMIRRPLADCPKARRML
jgi:hypothetical protein